MSENLFDKLTESQKNAVNTINRNIEIVACAGAGKTRTITRRIINLIRNGVDPENIVAITFTVKAAEEMRGRIYKAGEEYLGNTTGFSKMFIGTIDSFCLKMLQDFEDPDDHTNEFAKFSVLDEVQVKILLERYKKESGLKDSYIDKAQNLNYSYDFAYRCYYPDEKVAKKIDIYEGLMSILNSSWFDKEKRSRWSPVLLSCLNKYNHCLRALKYFDFSGLLREMIERMDPDSDTNGGKMSAFGRYMYDKVKYLTIDEYQDTNPSQEYLVSLFSKYGKANICVVGDADQTIYGFRGSDSSNILDFVNKFDAECFYLDEDFRSTKAIVDVADVSISNNHVGDTEYVHMKQGVVPENPLAYEEGDVVTATFESYDDEAAFITERIAKLHESGVPYSEIAVLFKQRNYLVYGKVAEAFQKTLSKCLQEAEIPYIVEGLNQLFETSEYIACKGIFLYLYAGMWKSYDYNAETKEGKNGFLTLEDKERIESEDAAQQDTLRELWKNVGCGIDPDNIDKAIKALSVELRKKKRFGHEFNMQQIYQDFISNLRIMPDEDAVDNKVERLLYNLGKFSKVIADFELHFFKDSPQYKVSWFVKHLIDVADGLYPEGIEDNVYIKSDAVRLMTVHQSKGLEFTAVFVPTLTEKLYPNEGFDRNGKIYSPIDVIEDFAGNDAKNWIPNFKGYYSSTESERNVYYVAVTRAKKYLFLTRSERYGSDSLNESQFLYESKKSEYLKPFDENREYTSANLPVFEDQVIPITLNFSVLSNYFDCPYRFKISNLYGYVQPYKTEQGYGKMLHEIMQHIHRAWEEKIDLTDEQIDRIAEESVYLPFASTPQIEKTLVSAKQCAHAYVEQNKADADKIVASEMDIIIEMGDGVSVNGRIDLIKKIDRNDGTGQTAIVDLKSAGKDAEQCLNAEQLKIYAIGYKEATGCDADYIMIYNLDHPDGSKNAEEKVVEVQLKETREHIKTAAEKIRKSELPKHKGSHCEKCYVKDLCGKR